MADAYQLLGVARDATDQAIRAAYRERVKRMHPDRHGGTEAAHEAFLELQAAYEVLSDPDRRAAHDLDPEGVLGTEVWVQRRKAQLKRRRARLDRLYRER